MGLLKIASWKNPNFIPKSTLKITQSKFISSSQLNASRRLHLSPINLVIYKEFIIPNLEACFALICFQRLSEPNIATERCPWQDSSQTRGSFIPVLSSHILLSLEVQTISSPDRQVWGGDILQKLKNFYPVAKGDTSRYGVRPKIDNNSFLLFLRFVAQFSS